MSPWLTNSGNAIRRWQPIWGADEVWAAVDLWREIGRTAFLGRFEVRAAAKYVVVEGSDEIDALALLVGARYLARRPVAAAYRGDRRSVADPLRELGFFVEAIGEPGEVPVDSHAFDYAAWLRRFDGVTDQPALARRRREQAALRATLGLQSHGRATCGLCGRNFPSSLIAAAHIKPRSECSPQERTDAPWVVMPACRLGCDSLFEHGFISVGQLGAMLLAPDCPVPFDIGDRAPAWREEREKYFEWHRRNRFRV